MNLYGLGIFFVLAVFVIWGIISDAKQKKEKKANAEKQVKPFWIGYNKPEDEKPAEEKAQNPQEEQKQTKQSEEVKK